MKDQVRMVREYGVFVHSAKIALGLAGVAFVLGALAAAGCRGKDPISELHCVSMREARERVQQGYLVLEYQAGEWKPRKLLELEKWSDRANHLVATGTVALYESLDKSPIAEAPAEGPPYLEQRYFDTVPADVPAATRALILDGARFTLRLPELPEGSAWLERARFLKWTPHAIPADLGTRIVQEPWVVDLSALPREDRRVSRLGREAGEVQGPEGLRSPFPIEVLHWSGSPKNRVNLVILAEGYTEAEMAVFAERAREMTRRLMEDSFFKEYRDLINVVRIDTPSRESGVSCDDGTARQRKNRFSTLFPVACLNALIGTDINDRFVYQSDLEKVIVDSHALYYEGASIMDETYILARSDKYGGSSILWATQTDVSGWDTAPHELGHSWGRLGDEYEVRGDVCHWEMAFASNLSTRKDSLEALKWKGWVLTDTPIPTPKEPKYRDRVGMFQGAAGGCFTQLYRPMQTCKMRDAGRKPFCSVCMEQMILRLYDRASLIEGPLVRSGDQIDAPVARGRRLGSRWLVDGRLVQSSRTYEPLRKIPADARKVRLEVWDAEAPVRRDYCSLVFSAETKI